MEQRLDISLNSIIKVFFAGLIFYVIFLVRDVLIWFFFALIIALLVEPAINFLRKLYFPKVLAVTIIYLSIFGILGLMIYLTAPIFVFEINQFSQNIPAYFERISPLLQNLGIGIADNFNEFTKGLVISLKDSSGSIFKAISIFFGGIASAIMIFTFAFYISLEQKGIEKVISLLSPKKYEEYILSIFEKSQYQVARWFGSRILACIFVGIVSFIIFFLLNVKYAFTLSIISGILTFVPFIGPFITALLAILIVGPSQSWLLAFYIVIALTVLQQVENSFVTPLLMKQFLDLPPLLVLTAFLIGGIVFGMLGMIFFIPVFGIAYQFLKEFLEKRREIID